MSPLTEAYNYAIDQRDKFAREAVNDEENRDVLFGRSLGFASMAGYLDEKIRTNRIMEAIK